LAAEGFAGVGDVGGGAAAEDLPGAEATGGGGTVPAG